MSGVLPSRGSFNLTKALKKAADPSGVLTGESKSFKDAVDPSTMLDPGGAVLEAGGSTMGRDYADPLGVLSGGSRPGDVGAGGATLSPPSIDDASVQAAKLAEQRRNRLRGGRASTILSSSLSSSGTSIGTATLLGQ
jgi:hypothetical protein